MIKTSVYLPADLKSQLSARAKRSGGSEAELIRRAIEQMLDFDQAVEDEGALQRFEPRRGPLLIGVGLGPGNPRQVTRLARDTLIAADRVITLSWTERSIGLAEGIIRAIAPSVEIQRLVVDINKDEAGRRQSLQAVAESVASALDDLEVVVVAVLGDPSLWSTFPDLAALVAFLRPAVPIERVPGILAYQVLASRAGIELARHGQRLVVAEGELPEEAVADRASTLVIYKGSPAAEVLRVRSANSGRLEAALIGERVDMPGERIGSLVDTADGPISYLATVIFPAEELRS